MSEDIDFVYFKNLEKLVVELITQVLVWMKKMQHEIKNVVAPSDEHLENYHNFCSFFCVF